MLQHQSTDETLGRQRQHQQGLPSSKELGALLQDSLYESTGLAATYTGESLETVASMTHRSHLTFEGKQNGAWRLRWEDGFESRLRATPEVGESPRRLLTDMLYRILRRWSVRQPDLGPLMVGTATAEEPAWMSGTPKTMSAALNVDAHLVEISLSFEQP